MPDYMLIFKLMLHSIINTIHKSLTLIIIYQVNQLKIERWFLDTHSWQHNWIWERHKLRNDRCPSHDQSQHDRYKYLLLYHTHYTDIWLFWWWDGTESILDKQSHKCRWNTSSSIIQKSEAKSHFYHIYQISINHFHPTEAQYYKSYAVRVRYLS